MKNQKAITLIALIITIIVMLILVGVSVTVALNRGLFSTAQQATSKTQLELEKEQLLSAALGAINNNGKVEFDVLDNNLPEGFAKTGERTYTSESGNTFTVSENAAITLVGQTGGDPGGTVPSTYKTSISGLAEGVTLVAYENLETETTADIKVAVDAGKIQAVLKETQTVGGESTTYTAVVPTGFEISTTDGEDSISGGLVIYDGTSSSRNNEFVWIPVTDVLGSSYSSGTNYSEPKYLTSNDSDTSSPYDSQTTIDYYYGNKADGSSYYTIDSSSADSNGMATNTTSNGTTFDYGYHYAEMVGSVNKYDGFYIGRYETTIDSEGNIGSEYNTEVLTAGSILKEGTNEDDMPYYYRWWGLYATQRNANVSGNGQNVQTAMIYGVLWDKTMDYIRAQKTAGNTTYDVDTATATWHGSANGHTAVVNSAQANAGDVALNIWDLESNAIEWTQEAYSTYCRAFRGGYYFSYSASYRDNYYPYNSYISYSSRVALYIK